MEYGYLDTEYTDFIDANEVDQSGNDLIRAPENSVAANLDYTWMLSGGSKPAARIALLKLETVSYIAQPSMIGEQIRFCRRG